MMRPRSLRSHLFAAIGGIVVLSVGLTIVIGTVLTRRAVEHATLEGLSHQADLIAARERVAVFPLGRLKDLAPLFARQHERFVTPNLDRPSPYLPAAVRARVAAGTAVNGTLSVNGSSYFFAARRVADTALVLLRAKGIAALSWPYLEGLLLAGLGGATLAALASFLLARRIARPVGRVAQASRMLALTESHEPLPVEGPQELATLAESFNEMADQLARARAAERRFLLSVSHELKTPLTAIRGYSEGLVEGAFEPEEAGETIRVEAMRLERLVQDLLDLARMNRSEFSIHREPIDLADLARAAVRRYEGQARFFGVRLEAAAEEHAPALGDPDRMLQIVSNLVENALRLTPPDGVVRVFAEPGRLTVEDSGPGLRAEELDRAFERFYLHSRYGGERPVGTGLGLAIVKELAQGMGGAVAVESEPGALTRFTVTLPVAPVPLPTPYAAQTTG